MKRFKTSSLRGTIWILMLGMPAARLHAADRPNARELERMSGEMEKLSTQVGPKVVQIVTQGLKVSGAGEEQPAGVLVAERGCGSGFFVSSDGYLFTNAHVIANATRIKVLVQPADRAARSGSMIEYPGTLVGVDAENDLALVKIAVEGVPFFDLGSDATARQGQLVLAYGSPMGLSQSASLGLVSAADRQLSTDDPRTFIQTDASINPGNSGGPLVDLGGSLLGINTMILSQSGGSEGIGFAVPLNVIQPDYAGLREKGMVARPLLGIEPRSLTADLIAGLRLKVRQGVLVEDVAPMGAAAAAGLLPGDVLISLNTRPIRNLRDLFRAESDLSAGASVEVAVMRREDMRLLRITPAAPRVASGAQAPGSVSEKENLVFRLGLFGTTLTPAMASTAGGMRIGRGVLVLALAGSGLSGPNAIAPGDVVHGVNGGVVDGMESLRAALETIPDGAPIVLQIEREGALSYLTVGEMPAPEHLPRRVSATPGAGGAMPPKGSFRY